jgi:hypothetical protein
LPSLYLENLVEKHLHDKNISDQLRQDMFEYYTKRMIGASIKFLIQGESATGRGLLAKCKNTKLFRARWRRWWMLSYVSPKILVFLLYIRNRSSMLG